MLQTATVPTADHAAAALVFIRSFDGPSCCNGISSNANGHFEALKVVHPTEESKGYRSKLVALVPFQRGDLIAKISGVSMDVPCSYTTVQYATGRHLELNSDLVYCNHSCDPTVAFDMAAMEVRALASIPVGGELTFFYPSTEWAMEQPFICWCKSPKCVHLIAGAKFLSIEKLSQYFMNSHIREQVYSALSSTLI
eukprot:TRINITY_DN5255_c0_g1_i2.p1 TRINITY_DN5255_c0_g1~~TRINITY_DN5255_c0_g1_i2.p1  ORF type:complete len:196 (-),score=14.92 TRINITY_DN5255_c0_g1_i2:138-725(-)